MQEKEHVNCKDGLNREQEITARKIRKILVNERDDRAKKIVSCAIEKFKLQYGKNDNFEPFDKFLRKDNLVLWSAIKRINLNILEYLEKNNLFFG